MLKFRILLYFCLRLYFYPPKKSGIWTLRTVKVYPKKRHLREPSEIPAAAGEERRAAGSKNRVVPSKTHRSAECPSRWRKEAIPLFVLFFFSGTDVIFLFMMESWGGWKGIMYGEVMMWNPFKNEDILW